MARRASPGAGPTGPDALRDFDPTVPNPARIYDAALGGKDNFPPDREALRQLEAVVPGVSAVALEHRGFLVRAVRTMAAAGIRQFLDLGTGIPTSPNVHEIARETHADARVVYVDNDPTVLAHARVFLAKQSGVVVLGHDARQPDQVLADPDLLAGLDLSEPTGLLVVGLMHYVDRDVGDAVVARYRAALAPGSMLALSTFSSDDTSPEVQRVTMEAFHPSPLYYRSRDEIRRLFQGFDLLEPGLDTVSGWRNDAVDPERERLSRGVVGGVATLA